MIQITNNEGNLVTVHNDNYVIYDYVTLVDEITIPRNRNVQLSLVEDFIKTIVPGTLNIFVTPVDCPYNYRMYVHYEDDKIYINTNARTKDLSWRYVNLKIMVVGIRWDSYVVNKLVSEIGDKI